MRAENLMKSGISKGYAWTTACSGAKIAYICQRGAINYAVTKERLTRFGLVPLVHLLFSCPIGADLVSIDGGIDHHHAIPIIIPLAAMVLHPALGCLRINDGLYKPA